MHIIFNVFFTFVLSIIQEGDEIKAFDKVCEVQSDKATVEITSRFAGIVARVYSVEGDVVKVPTLLLSFPAVGLKRIANYHYIFFAP